MVAIGANCALSGDLKPLDKMMRRVDPREMGGGVESEVRKQFRDISEMIRRANAAAAPG